MQIDPQMFLDLAEECHQLAFVDIESTGLKGDYNAILVVSIKPYGKKPIPFVCKEPGNDQDLVNQVYWAIQGYSCIVTYYGKGFDIPMINTRLLTWEEDPLEPIHHIDMYYTLKSKILTGRRSQGHLLQWLELPELKMGVSASEWNRVQRADTRDEAMKVMVKRCNSDVTGLEGLYKRTRQDRKSVV